MYLPTASESGMEDMESEEEPGSEIGELGRQVGLAIGGRVIQTPLNIFCIGNHE
jgi:hypothetical protein